MTLKEARKRAIVLAKTLDDPVGVITIWRMRPRVFNFQVGYGPRGNDTVMIVHASWAKEGWYDKYHPEWIGSNVL